MAATDNGIVIAELVGLVPTEGIGEAKLFTVDSAGNFTQTGSTQQLPLALFLYSGFFSDQGYANLAAYLFDSAQVHFYAINADNTFQLIGESSPGLQEVLFLVVGRFHQDAPYTDLLFLQRKSNAMRGQFFSTDGKGGLTKIGDGFDYPNYGVSTRSGHFDLNTDITDLLFFEGDSGGVEFFTTDGKGNLVQIGQKQTIAAGQWDDVLVGNFGGGTCCSDMMFYNGSTGEGQFFKTPGDGTLTPLADPTYMMSGGSLISGVFAGGTIFDDILVCSPSGEVQIYQTDGKGGLEKVGAKQSWPSNTQFCPISKVR